MVIVDVDNRTTVGSVAGGGYKHFVDIDVVVDVGVLEEGVAAEDYLCDFLYLLQFGVSIDTCFLVWDVVVSMCQSSPVATAVAEERRCDDVADKNRCRVSRCSKSGHSVVANVTMPQ